VVDGLIPISLNAAKTLFVFPRPDFRRTEYLESSCSSSVVGPYLPHNTQTMKKSRPALSSSLCWSLLLAAAAEAAPQVAPPEVDAGACPQIHIFAARETTAPPGFGTAKVLTDLIVSAFPGTTTEAIDYPAVGDDLYAASVTAGIAAVLNQTNTFVAQCPDTIIIMHGYSQVRWLLGTDGWRGFQAAIVAGRAST